MTLWCEKEGYEGSMVWRNGGYGESKNVPSERNLENLKLLYKQTEGLNEESFYACNGMLMGTISQYTWSYLFFKASRVNMDICCLTSNFSIKSNAIQEDNSFTPSFHQKTILYDPFLPRYSMPSDRYKRLMQTFPSQKPIIFIIFPLKFQPLSMNKTTFHCRNHFPPNFKQKQFIEQLRRMIAKPRRTSSQKYSVLKPSAEINTIRRSFGRPHPRCGYELAQANNMAVRRYKKTVESLDQMLQDWQWRFEEKSSIVHCLYVQLLAPSMTSKNISVEVYVEDLEVSMSKLKKLILPEAIYLATKAIEGYCKIWERFKNVSVDEQTIGLDCKGNCLVWLNSSLEKNHCQDFKIDTPHQITRQIISLIRSKSEPVCQALMSKLMDNLSREKFDFYETLHLVTVFAKTHQVKVPENLKYLVHQDRLSRGLEDKRTQMSVYESRDQIYTIKTPRFVPFRASYRQQATRSSTNGFNEDSKCMLSALRSTAGPGMLFLTCRSINHNKSADSSKEQESNLSQHQTRKRFFDSIADKENSFSSQHSRCKSQCNEPLSPLKKLRPRKESATINSNSKQLLQKRYSGRSEYTRSGGSFVNKFKKSSDHSLAELSTAKKLIHRSSNQMDSNQFIQSQIARRDTETYDLSPFFLRDDEPTKQKIPINIISPLQSSDPTFHVIPEPQEVIKANQWTTTLTNLLESGSKMNTSITEGQDTCSYLEDVRLQRLDTISKQMVVSLIPQDSQKMISSEELPQ